MIEIQDNPYTNGQRLVVVGTLGNPETVTQRHFDALPNKDARSSHLERFIADGLDLTGFDLRDLTTLDGTIANSNLYGATGSAYWYSRGCAYPKTTLPRDTSSIANHDMLQAIVQNYVADHPSLALKLREGLTKSGARWDDLSSSWHDTLALLVRVWGLTEAEIQDIFGKAFAPHPRLGARLVKELSTKRYDDPTYAPPWPLWKDADRVRAKLTNPNDRLEASLLLDGDLDIVAPRHYVLQWEPDPYLLTTPNPHPWGWWEKSPL